MNKIVLYAIVSIVVIAGAVGGYQYFTRTEVVQVEVPSAPQPTPTDSTTKPKPNHGSFEKRFEPKPPPADGGRGK